MPTGIAISISSMDAKQAKVIECDVALRVVMKYAARNLARVTLRHVDGLIEELLEQGVFILAHVSDGIIHGDYYKVLA